MASPHGARHGEGWATRKPAPSVVPQAAAATTRPMMSQRDRRRGRGFIIVTGSTELLRIPLQGDGGALWISNNRQGSISKFRVRTEQDLST